MPPGLRGGEVGFFTCRFVFGQIQSGQIQSAQRMKQSRLDFPAVFVFYCGQCPNYETCGDFGQQRAHQMSQPARDPVADHGISHLFADNKADLGKVGICCSRYCVNHEKTIPASASFAENF